MNPYTFNKVIKQLENKSDERKIAFFSMLRGGARTAKAKPITQSPDRQHDVLDMVGKDKGFAEQASALKGQIAPRSAQQNPLIQKYEAAKARRRATGSPYSTPANARAVQGWDY